MNQCRTCKLKILTDRRNPPKCQIAKWYCGLTGRLMNDGTQQDMEKAPGCAKWQKIPEIKEWNGL